MSYAPDPNDGLFWMDFEDACQYFWSITVVKADTDGKRDPTPMSDKARNKRDAVASTTKADKIIDALKAEFFSPYDANGDGVINRAELNSMEETLVALSEDDKMPFPAEAIQGLITVFLEALEDDEDGEVSWPEMLKIMATIVSGDEDATVEDLRKGMNEEMQDVSDDEIKDIVVAIQRATPA